MKKLFLLLSIISTCAFAQKKSCCQVQTISDKNAILASNNDFAATHAEPLAFSLENPKGEMITFKTDDGKTGSAYLIKASKQPAKKVLFVFQEWWGLNDHIKQEAEKFQSEMLGVDVYAIDMYDGKVGTTREEAQKYMTEMTDERARSIIRGAFTHVGKKVKVATVGWCFGGAWSLQAALMGGKQMKACVMYYGMPEMDITKLKTLKCDVLGIFAEKDKFINVELIKNFEDSVKKAGKKIVVYNYVADHAFANPSNPQFNKEATEDAHKKVMVYLNKRMKIKIKKK
jgi:carboxymethylenebutenolidase